MSFRSPIRRAIDPVKRLGPVFCRCYRFAERFAAHGVLLLSVQQLLCQVSLIARVNPGHSIGERLH